jgi:glutathione-regulated potassium-efflux system ancillary protein KefG
MSATGVKNQLTVLMFHPRLENSRVNKAIYQTVVQTAGIHCKDMYELYPDFNIDIHQEQQDLMAADIIVLQHPFYWYSAPPLVKQWIDLVLEHGWAYGKNGTALQNKKVLHIISSGGTFEVYSTSGKNRYSYLELLRPFELTYRLCLMQQLPPYIIPAANSVKPEEIELHGKNIQSILQQLRDGTLPETELQRIDYLNELSN